MGVLLQMILSNRTRKIIATLATIFLFFTYYSKTGLVYGNFAIPETMRIGIMYGRTSPSSVNVRSNSGISFGFESNSGYVTLFEHVSPNPLVVRKDSYFAKIGAVILEHDITKGSYSPGTLFGPFHIQLASFNTYSEALSAAEEFNRNNTIPAFPAYNSGWYLWAGLFLSEDEGMNAVSTINTDLKIEEASMVRPSSSAFQIVEPDGTPLMLVDGTNSKLVILPLGDKSNVELINIDGKNFRGSLEIIRQSDSDMTIVNLIGLEEYLYGVVPREMISSWPIEALKAQAVAARNFAIANINKFARFGFNLCSTTDCQAYGGYDAETLATNRAVDETRGKVLTHNNSIVVAYYHANSGGHTENVENVWSNPLPYLKGVPDPYISDTPHEVWQKSYTKGEVKNKLAQQNIDIGDILNMSLEEVSTNGRVQKLRITGTKDSIILEKERVRAVFGYSEIRSIWYTISSGQNLSAINSQGQISSVSPLGRKVATASGVTEISNSGAVFINNGSEVKPVSVNSESFVFNGRGWGHGIGMSQWGARGMAENGHNYVEILQYYYKDSIVK